MDYNGKYSWKDLLNLNYDTSAEKITTNGEENQFGNISNDNDMIDMKRDENNSLDDFKNDFD